jgi:hypothetical protein
MEKKKKKLSGPELLLICMHSDGFSLGKQGCQIFIGATYQNGKNIPNDYKLYQITLKYTKWPLNITNGHII